MISGISAPKVSLVLGLMAISVHLAPAAVAQTPPAPGFCEKRSTVPAFAIKQKKAPGFFKIKTGIFCTTPVVSSNGTLITGCDDAQVRMIGNNGALIRSIKIDHDPNSGTAANPEVVAIPGTSPEQFVVTSFMDQLVIRFDITGKILSKTKLGVDVGKPIALKNSSYFLADGDGVGRLYSAKSEPILFEMHTSYLNDPSVRISSTGENQIVISDFQGNVFVLNESGEMSSIKLGNSQLSNTKVAPDGKVWVSDDQGIMYIVDIETQGVRTINPGKGRIFTRPTFLKNGKVVFGADEYIFVYELSNLDRPTAIFDAGFSARDFHDGKLASYIGNMIKNSDLATLELEDGREYIWVPTYGGYHLINDQAAIVGIFEYGAGNGDAETYSSPVKLADGSFTLGMFYGIDRVTIRKSGGSISSSSWIRCE